MAEFVKMASYLQVGLCTVCTSRGCSSAFVVQPASPAAANTRGPPPACSRPCSESIHKMSGALNQSMCSEFPMFWLVQRCGSQTHAQTPSRGCALVWPPTMQHKFAEGLQSAVSRISPICGPCLENSFRALNSCIPTLRMSKEEKSRALLSFSPIRTDRSSDQ